jgi:transposase
MARYKYLDLTQGLFLTINLAEQLLPVTFEFTLNHLINQMDPGAFDAAYHNDEKGAPAYPPAVLLKIIIYCYSRGVITSRPIERACKTNMVVKALARDAEPDRDTVARFVPSNAQAMKTLFSEVLLKCNELGLIGGELFAVDGCKLPSNASKEWPGTIEELKQKKKSMETLAEKIVEQHKLLDKQKDEDKRFNKTCHTLVYEKRSRDI